jgi:hypothetical protein
MDHECHFAFVDRRAQGGELAFAFGAVLLVSDAANSKVTPFRGL